MPATPTAFLTAAALVIAGSAPAFAQPPAMDMSRMVDQIASADADQDGRVTRAEFLAARAARFDRFDRNHDGVLGEDDVPKVLAGRFTSMLAQLRSLFDKDRDGKVSRAEFVDGPTPVFDRVDTNHDGVIAADELAAARRQLAAAGR